MAHPEDRGGRQLDDLLGGRTRATLPWLLHTVAHRYRTRIAVVDGEGSYTYGELYEEAATLARSWVAIGLARGDRVAVWAPNSADWVVQAAGVWLAGGIVVPLSTRDRGIQLAGVLRQVTARFAVARPTFLDAGFLEMLRSEAGGSVGERPTGLDSLERVILLGSADEGPGISSAEVFRHAGAGVPPGILDELRERITPGDVFGILSTSGTTGRPKGVTLRPATSLLAYARWNAVAEMADDERYLIVHPYANASGFNAGLVSTMLPGAMQLPVERFDPDDCLDLVRRRQITMLLGPPTLYTRMMAAAGEGDLSSVRLACVGSTDIPVAFVERLRQAMPAARIVNAYGMAEACGVTMTVRDDPAEVVAGTAGRPLIGVRLRIVDDDGNDVAAGSEGEILIRSETLTTGYWEDPTATSAAIDPEGWYHSGDVGRLDALGNLVPSGRKKEMFIVAGFNVYPAEVEDLLVRHPDVAQAAVVDVPDPDVGQVGWAYVVPASGAVPDAAELQAWAKANMASYKVPRRLFVVPGLPITPNGKVQKRLLRDRAVAEASPEPGDG